MRALTLFTVTLAVVVGLATGAQALTLTMTADKETYGISETITLTVIGDSSTEKSYTLFGVLRYEGDMVTSNDDAVQSNIQATNAGASWILGVLQLDLPQANTADFFSAIAGLTSRKALTNLTSTMSFHADNSGEATFWWVNDGSIEDLDFFGLSGAPGVTVTIVPEPTTAGLMGLGLLGLVIAGRRRKS